jgi:hypothetical protein
MQTPTRRRRPHSFLVEPILGQTPRQVQIRGLAGNDAILSILELKVCNYPRPRLESSLATLFTDGGAPGRQCSVANSDSPRPAVEILIEFLVSNNTGNL